MAFPTPIFMKLTMALHRDILYQTSPQLAMENGKQQAQINLHPYVKNDCHLSNIPKTHACSAPTLNFMKI